MMLDLRRKSTNCSLLFLHLALQVIAGFWAVRIDGYACLEQFVLNVTYFAYGLVVLNLLLFAIIQSRPSSDTDQFMYYLPLIANFGLCAGMLYFTIEGYNKYNTCGHSKALYQFFFISIIIAIVLSIVTLFSKFGWSDRYAHWPGNLAWPILFLKTGFPAPLAVTALIIGIIFSVISVLGLLVNCLYYNSMELESKKSSVLRSQGIISLLLMTGLQILAIVMLVITKKQGDYHWQYCRKILVIFAGVNIIDILFSIYGYLRIRVWSSALYY